MIRISDSIRDIVKQNPFLLFGLGNRLMNLSRVASFLRPLVVSRSKKDVSEAAILMNLSRLQKNLSKSPYHLDKFHFEKLTIHSNLCSLSFLKTHDLHRKINRFSQFIEKEKGYINITEGLNEVTLLFDQDFLDEANRMVGERPKNVDSDIASVGIKYQEKYNQIPGMLHQIIQQLAFQSINLLEIASTHTEFIFYVPQKDVHLAFDTLYNSFGKNESRARIESRSQM